MTTLADAPVAAADHPAFTGSGFDPARAEGAGFTDTLRHLRTSIRLGWRVESNWTDPLLFFIYTVAKPVASLLLLVFMVQIVGGTGTSGEAVRTFVVLGSALWAMLVAGIAGPAWSVLDDRERYRMLKYLYVSPATFLLVLAGRGVAKLAVGAMGTAVALVFAVLVLGLRVDLGAVHWPMLVLTLVLGLPPILALGVGLAAICLQTRQESWSYPEAFAGALFLVSGVVFPLSILPTPIQLLGLLNPVTWWVAGVRGAILPTGASSIGGPGSLWLSLTSAAAPDRATTIAVLLATGAVSTLVAVALFRVSERRARERGLLDLTTGS
jgi:ABC-2 type transport system permease protein